MSWARSSQSGGDLCTTRRMSQNHGGPGGIATKPPPANRAAQQITVSTMNTAARTTANLWPARGAAAGGACSVQNSPVPGRPTVARRPRGPMVNHAPRWPMGEAAAVARTGLPALHRSSGRRHFCDTLGNFTFLGLIAAKMCVNVGNRLAEQESTGIGPSSAGRSVGCPRLGRWKSSLLD